MSFEISVFKKILKFFHDGRMYFPRFVIYLKCNFGSNHFLHIRICLFFHSCWMWEKILLVKRNYFYMHVRVFYMQWLHLILIFFLPSRIVYPCLVNWNGAWKKFTNSSESTTYSEFNSDFSHTFWNRNGRVGQSGQHLLHEFCHPSTLYVFIVSIYYRYYM